MSEKVALGLLKGSAKLTGEAQFDKRLFNQSSGMDQGFGADDDYNVYSKPLLDREDAAAIYRPRKQDDGPSADDQYAALTSSSKFAAPERGFAGTEGGARPRDGPVQFEADAPSAAYVLANIERQRAHVAFLRDFIVKQESEFVAGDRWTLGV